MTHRFHNVEDILRSRKNGDDDGKILEIGEGLEKLFALLGANVTLVESRIPENRTVGTMGKMLSRFRALLK